MFLFSPFVYACCICMCVAFCLVSFSSFFNAQNVWFISHEARFLWIWPPKVSFLTRDSGVWPKPRFWKPYASRLSVELKIIFEEKITGAIKIKCPSNYCEDFSECRCKNVWHECHFSGHFGHHGFWRDY